MFERFARDARDVVVHAQQEAAALGHDWIGTEHLLLGAVADPRSDGARMLASFGLDLARARADVVELVGRGGAAGLNSAALATLGIDLDEVRARVEATFGPGALSGRSCGRPSFTGPAKKALELAVREAQHLGDDQLGAMHLLLGVLREGDGAGAAILARHGVLRDDLVAAGRNA
jgi:ATP-dependent Clp protease ATP-binding subunit ClpA